MSRSRWILGAGLLAAAGCASDPNFVPARTPVASIRLVPQNDSIPFGGSLTLVAQPLDAGGLPTVPDSTPIWTSLTPSILVVDGVGHVQAIWFGSGSVKVRIDRIEAGTNIFVGNPPIDTLYLTPVTATVAVGDTVRITAVARNAARLPAPTTGIVWRTTDTTRVRVDSTGLVTGVATGSAIVWAALAGFADSSVVTVVPASP